MDNTPFLALEDKHRQMLIRGFVAQTDINNLGYLLVSPDPAHHGEAIMKLREAFLVYVEEKLNAALNAYDGF